MIWGKLRRDSFQVATTFPYTKHVRVDFMVKIVYNGGLISLIGLVVVISILFYAEYFCPPTFCHLEPMSPHNVWIKWKQKSFHL